MNISEYEKVKNLNYLEYCNYLKAKYGEAKYNYTYPSFNKNHKVTRTSEGLFCHHIYENYTPLLSKPSRAKQYPFEYQLAQNLVYCDFLEHLFLHILIYENPPKDKDPLEVVGVTGIMMCIVPELNDLFSGFKPTQPWQVNIYNKVVNDKDVYFSLLKRFKPTLKNNYPNYTDRMLFTSHNSSYGLWNPIKNKKIYDEIKDL